MYSSEMMCQCPLENANVSMAGACGNNYAIFMTLIQQLVSSICSVKDSCNRVRDREVLDDVYDFIVIGGGTAGSVVAGRLAENPNWKVLLMEAGGDEPPASSIPSFHTAYLNNSELNWRYETEPETKACLEKSSRRCYWPRGKVLGGSSVLNGMAYFRTYPETFDQWAAGGAEGWSYNDVRPYFLMSEDNEQIGELVDSVDHRAGGPLTIRQFRYQHPVCYDILEAGLELGYNVTNDLNGEHNRGFAIFQTTTRGGSRLSLARAYLRPHSHSKNLHVSMYTHATRVLFEDGKTVGVEYFKNGVLKTVRVKNEVILSSGALNSPTILMHSGIGPKDVLQEQGIEVLVERPGVGRNLYNHIGVNLFFEMNTQAVRTLDWEGINEYLKYQDGPMSGNGITQVTAILNSKYAEGDIPDLQYFFYAFEPDCSMTGIQREPIDPLNPSERQQVTITACLLNPKSVGNITLRSNNPLDYPKFHSGFFDNEYDATVLVEGVRKALDLTKTQALGKKNGLRYVTSKAPLCNTTETNVDKFSDEYIRCLISHYTDPQNHQVGTCKMGSRDDPTTVVDSELRVIGVEGLRVMDASVMPTNVHGNPVATIVMIAEKGVANIKQTYA